MSRISWQMCDIFEVSNRIRDNCSSFVEDSPGVSPGADGVLAAPCLGRLTRRNPMSVSSQADWTGW